ncbi:MAG: DUF2935 domain-containing protein [Lachnospiraceae bacterium]|nr:DUF2935 domain-containing protein [Lachnospiraceae bacterium]
MENYEILSLETHLFFARIMKEHAFFLEAGFQGKNGDYIRRADRFKVGFERILAQAIALGNGMVRNRVLVSGEFFTEYTHKAEMQSSFLTGIRLDTALTRQLRQMQCGQGRISCGFSNQVDMLNQRALRLLDGLIDFKEELLREVKSCRLYTANYPLLIEHILREAKLYRCQIQKLQGREMEGCRAFARTEVFWNQIMMEHALFIRGLLDPTEEALIGTADEFAKEYKALLEEAKKKDCQAEELTARTRQETIRYREFKAAGTKGITECQISSLILPLLADHVLREANHYLRLLEDCDGVMEL